MRGLHGKEAFPSSEDVGFEKYTLEPSAQCCLGQALSGDVMIAAATRRRFFSLMGASPLVAKVAADKTVADISGLNISGLGTNDGLPIPSSDAPSTAQYRMALSNPTLRSVIEGMLYEDERKVYQIDSDLAAMKSWSLNAKITFQRQRVVETRIKYMREEHSWNRIQRFVMKALGFSL